MNHNSKPQTILVTGATGNVGSALISELASAGHHVRALARNVDSLPKIGNVETIRGDLSKPETLDRPLDGVHAIFFLVRPGATEVGPALIHRIRSHTKRLVFLSTSVVRDDLKEQPNIIARLHAEIENLIKQAGFDWTFLRPGMFAINTVNWWGTQIRAGNVIRWPYPGASLSPLDPRDIAAVAARCLVQTGHTHATYLLTGPQALTQAKMLECIALATGRKLRLEEISPEAARKELVPYIPPFVLEILLDYWAKTEVEPPPVTDTVYQVTGSLPRTFREWTMDNAFRFGSGVTQPPEVAQAAGAR